MKRYIKNHEKAKPLILITNDDGISAPGIRALIDNVRHEVVVIILTNPSSKWACYTINNTLYLNKISKEMKHYGIQLLRNTC
jgi:5'-nucleotidase